MSSKFKNIQNQVLKAFQEEIPSIYYSDKGKSEFNKWKKVMEYHYHDLMKFPKALFKNKDLLDLGAGTGENTVYFDNWGAKCTLVEINSKAHDISKKIFSKYAIKNNHSFINKSIYDFNLKKKFDIVHSRGVFAHTNDPRKAFKKLASFLKTSGYLIYGDGNKSGNFQNMLQRLAIFSFADNWNDMVKVAEKLFKEDLDRSVKFANRTRRCIIFDKWVVPRLTNPSVREVLSWFKENKITLYSFYPNILPPSFGDSLHHRPTFDINKFMTITSIAEMYWLVQTNMDKNEIPKIYSETIKISKTQDEMVEYIDDYNLEDLKRKKINNLIQKVDNYSSIIQKHDFNKYIKNKTKDFCNELNEFLSLVERKNLKKVCRFLRECKILFRGAQGIRHIDFIGYKK